jgi:hypothetical protein
MRIICVCTTLALTSCGQINTAAEASAEEKTTATAEEVTVPLTVPDYTIVKSEVGGSDAAYRVQVGDTLPSEPECLDIFQQVTRMEAGPATRNTAVYFTRAGFSPLISPHAYVMQTKGEAAPRFLLQTASNERLQQAAALRFDSIPGKQLVVECLEAQGAKIFIYQKPSGPISRCCYLRTAATRSNRCGPPAVTARMPLRYPKPKKEKPLPTRRARPVR